MSVDFKLSRGRVLHAVDRVSFALHKGETLGIIGESGSGKSTLARAVMGIEPLSSGSVALDGSQIGKMTRRARRAIAPRMQMIFQDPSEALDPHLTCRAAVAEPLVVQGRLGRNEILRKVGEALERVGLSEQHGSRRPRELSGGQRQRVNIARALTLDPDVLVCDEAVSALDVSVQAEVLNLLLDLQDERGLAYLFISHDIGVVARVCHKVGVMYLGGLVETGSADDLVKYPQHPYTSALLSAEPQALPSRLRTKTRIVLSGEIPSPLDPPRGCRFVTRCVYAKEVCSTPPPLADAGAGRTAACHFVGELELAGEGTNSTSASADGSVHAQREEVTAKEKENDQAFQ